MKNIRNFILFATMLAALAVFAQAQSYTYDYKFKFENALVDKWPKINGLDFNIPEAAQKNGVEGIVKAAVVLGTDGKTRDIVVSETLPFGVDEAVRSALAKLYFTPGSLQGTPAPVKMSIEIEITATYDENDKEVTKARLLGKATAPYPSKYLADKVKGKVDVRLIVYADGRTKIDGVSSTMERDFDAAALEAARYLKFEPAVHKKSKKAVTQAVTVTFDFKP